jgi:hypothetical protein
MMKYIYLACLTLGLLASCGRAEDLSTVKPTAPQEPAPSTADATAPPATDAPTSTAAIAASSSTATPQQGGVPIVRQATVGPATTGLPLSTLAAQQPSPPPRTPGVVTRDDNQRTIHLAVGETFTLQLGQLYNWTVQIADERVLARVADRGAGPDAQGVYRALAPGQTLLEAQGDPVCWSATPACMLPSIAFSVRIVVA